MQKDKHRRCSRAIQPARVCHGNLQLCNLGGQCANKHGCMRMHANIQQGGMCDVILRDNLTMAVVPLGIEGPCFQQNEPHLAMGAMSQPKHTKDIPERHQEWCFRHQLSTKVECIPPYPA